MRFLFLTSINLFFALTCLAANFQGIISKPKNKLTITLTGSSDKSILLLPINSEIDSQLNKLSPADFVTLEGNLSENGVSILVSSINSVGLKKIIGDWTGDDEFCYRFLNYSTLSIYNKNDKLICDFKMIHLAREFSYVLSPATSGWSVLLSDNVETYLMDLKLNSKKSAELSLYDSRSGDILRQIKIKR